MTSKKTAVETSTEFETAIKALFDRNLVLYNDDVNSFDHVIECLVDYCEHDPIQAEQCAHIVHFNGKCSIKKGTFDMLQPIAEKLLEKKLSVKIE